MRTKLKISVVEPVNNMKQPKLSFLTEAKKRKNEDNDDQVAKKQKKDVLKEAMMVKKKFSNCMKDAVKSQCKICRYTLIILFCVLVDNSEHFVLDLKFP